MISGPKNRPVDDRGIALVSVLLISIILLALAGAFFAAHKTDLMLMGTSVQLEKSKNAVLSASEFFQYKLQNDRYFGTTPFVNGKIESFPEEAEEPLLTVEYFSKKHKLDANRVVGTIHKTGLTFEGRLLNNLSEDGVGTHPLGTTPPHSVRVWVTAKEGVVVKQMDFILKRSPFSSVSMLSGGDIQVDLANSEDGHWWLGARQPSGNAVRAAGQVTGPEVLSKSGRAVLFEAPQGLGNKIQPPYGVIQAESLRMQMDGVMTDIQSDDDRLEEVEENILGVLSPDSAEVDVPVLDAEELTSPINKFPIPAQTVTFRTRENSQGQMVHELLEDDTVVATYDGRNPWKRTYTWGSGAKLAATFDLETRTMRVSKDFELTSQGSFTLRGVQGNSKSGGIFDWDTDEGHQPTLVLGNHLGGASISANGIDIRGSVGGMGALKAGKDDLRVRAKSSLSTTPDYGVALHSEEDVVLSKPGSSSSDGIPSDWDAFSLAFEEEPDSSLDYWAEMPEEKKAGMTREFAEIVLSEPGTEMGEDPIWLSLTDDFPADERAREVYETWTEEGEGPTMIPDPDWDPDIDDGPPEMIMEDPGDDAGPGFNVENYVRMREYLKTLKNGNPDETWLFADDPDVQLSRRNDVMMLIKNQLSSFQLLAGQRSYEVGGHVILEWNKLSDYFSGSNPFRSGYSADMKFRGLIYAGDDFRFDTQQQGIEIEGALVAKGDIDIINATGARIIYNSELLENMFITNEGDTSAKLERAYWAYY